jgi:hypothetical protein
MATLEWICQDRMIFLAYVAGFTSVTGDADRQQLIGAISTAAELFGILGDGDVVCGHFDDPMPSLNLTPATTFGNGFCLSRAARSSIRRRAA